MKRVSLVKKIKTGGNYFAAPKDDIEFIPTGCKVLDLALGGGWVEGRIANIVGDKSTGKTLLCIEAAANFLLKYPTGTVRYAECEAAFDKKYAQALGMPIDKVDFVTDPLETVEDFYDDLSKFVSKKGEHCLYILDSLDALSDRAEMEREFGKASYGGGKAKDMSKLFRMLTRKVEQSNTTLIIVSQVRDAIGAMFKSDARSGGRAMDFYATHVAYLQYLGKIPKAIDGIKRTVGVKIRAKIDKNKIALPFREARFNIMFGYGTDDLHASIEFLRENKGLQIIDVKNNPKAIKAYYRNVSRADQNEYAFELDRLHSAVTSRWYEIETSFLPRRAKYG